MDHLQWAANAGVLLRERASLTGFDNGFGVRGSELQLGGGVAYVDEARHFDVSGEALFGGGIGSGHTLEQSTLNLGGAVGRQLHLCGHDQGGPGN